MLRTITLSNFRNHALSRINAACAKNVVLFGENGSGKTAVLEAISMFSGNGGLRGATMNEILRLEKPPRPAGTPPQEGNRSTTFTVNAELSDETALSISYNAGDSGRKLRIDNDSTPLSAASRAIRILWLTPKEDRLWTESASDRRAFLDRFVAGFDPAHLGRVSRLSKLLSERAFVLKKCAGAKDTGEESRRSRAAASAQADEGGWLNAIEKQLAETSVAVAAARVAYAAQINYFLELETNARLTISGMLENQLASGALCSDIEKEYLDYLRANREIMNDKMIVDGAHKTDFSIFRNDLCMHAAVLSTGQQKKLLMLFIIANAKLLNAKTNAKILLLLDEAAAHLDESSLHDLFERLAGTDVQVWWSGVSRDAFSNLKNALFVSCKDGQVNTNIQS